MIKNRRRLALLCLMLSTVLGCKVESSETAVDEADARPQIATEETDPLIKAPDDHDTSAKSQPIWQNIALDSSNVPACATCHVEKKKLGALSADYCDSVLMPSIQSERQEWNAILKKIETVDIHQGKNPPMPPSTENPATFASDIGYIKEQCRSAVESAGSFWSWD